MNYNYKVTWNNALSRFMANAEPTRDCGKFLNTAINSTGSVSAGLKIKGAGLMTNAFNYIMCRSSRCRT